MSYLWHNKAGQPIDCDDKRTVLQESMCELEQQCRDALDDALLMGASQASAKAALHQLIDNLTPTVKERP